MGGVECKSFESLNLDDSFFDSLRDDYKEFNSWFDTKKAMNEKAFVISDEGKIEGFLYLKYEDEDDVDPTINPPLPPQNRIKMGTFKVIPKKTRLGERFIKIAIDEALNREVNYIYVTAFQKHSKLIELLCEFGFKMYGNKETKNGVEQIYIKSLTSISENIITNYPFIHTKDVSKYLISIFPDYHTELFPDSKLQDESDDIIQDISYTNSIHKIYISWADQAKELKRGDILVFYRTSDIPGRAYYRAVATSIGTVEEVKTKNDFKDQDDFIEYCKNYSVFPHHNLKYYYQKSNLTTIKFLYNTAFKKKIIRKNLLEIVMLNGQERWTLLPLNEIQFNKILELSKIKSALFKLK